MKCFILILLICAITSGCNKNKHHVVKKFYEDGKLKSETEYIGRYANGTGKMYYPDGNLLEVRTFKNGKPHGKSLIYHKNGKLKIKQTYSNGQLHGKYFLFSEDGTKIEETNWVKGYISFERSFTPNGDTLSIRRGNKVTSYYHSEKIGVIACIEGNYKVIGRIKFSADGSFIKQEGILTCLTKNDTLLLNAQYPGWTNQ